MNLRALTVGLSACRAHLTHSPHFERIGNNIGAVSRGRLRASWRGQASGLLLEQEEEQEEQEQDEEQDDDDDDEVWKLLSWGSCE